jgi:hypothetical protein
MIDSYPQIFNVEHPAAQPVLGAECYVEEKVDGSQLSFKLADPPEGATPFVFPGVEMRSKGKQLIIDPPEATEKLFVEAVRQVKARTDLLRPGYVYRGEFLRAPRHNTLKYDRAPKGNVCIFDVYDRVAARWLTPGEKAAEAERLGFDVVPLLHTGPVNKGALLGFLDRESYLGGVKVEGVVLKPVGYDLYGRDGKPVFAKWVSDQFKEAHRGEFRNANPHGGDILARLGDTYRTEARWRKAEQHLREAGVIGLEPAPQDIGPILVEVARDIEREAKDEILRDLWKWAWPAIKRSAGRGLPEWYKARLFSTAFGEDEGTEAA